MLTKPLLQPIFLLFVSATLILFACDHKKDSNEKSNYFEGFVESKIDIQPSHTNLTDKLRSIYGERVITYINTKGFFSREFIDSNNIIINKEVYNPDSLKMFFFKVDNDTVKYYNVTKSDLYENISVEWSDSITILNNTVRGVKSINKYHEKKSGKTYSYITTSYNLQSYNFLLKLMKM